MTRNGSARAIPPALVEPTIARPHLLAALDAASARRLTTVIAAAGFGKSTLLATWVEGRRAAWYTIDPADRDPARLAAGIVDSLGVWIPALDTAVGSLLGAGRGPDADADAVTRASAHASLVADALDRHLQHDIVQVIDDLSELTRDDPGMSFVEGLIRMAPPRLHVVIASRTELPFPIERLRGRGELVDIDGLRLGFTEDEVRRWVVGAVGQGASALAGPLHAATAGWPVAVRLGIEALQRAKPADRERTLAQAIHPGGSLYEYLVREALGSLAADDRQWLEMATVLPRVSGHQAGAFAIAGGAATLDRLVRGGQYLQPVGDGASYRLTPLMREYAIRELLPAPERANRLRRTAAAWFEAQGDDLDALECLAAIADADGARALLRRRGPALIANGAAAAVIDAIDRLASDGGADDPGLDALEGSARRMRGDWSGAMACFRRGIQGRRGPIPAGIAWQMGLIEYLRGDIEAAIRWYARGRRDDPARREVALLDAWWASALWVRGEVEACRHRAGSAFTLAEATGDDHALAAAHTVLAMLAAMDSDRRANDAHYLRALDHAARAGDAVQSIRIRVNRGSRFAEEGYYPESLAELDEAIRLADLAGFAAFRALALSNRGEVLLHLGRFDEAISDLEVSRGLYQRLESAMVSYPLVHLGEVYRERGDMTLARANFEEGLEVAQDAGDLQGLVPALSGLARVVVRHDPERATALAARAVDAGPVLGRASALLAAGWVALARGRRGEARAAADEAEELARHRRDRSAIAEAIELSVRAAPSPVGERERLDEALDISRDLGDPLGVARAQLAMAELLPLEGSRPMAETARATLRAVGARPSALNATRLIERSESRLPPSIEIRTMGGFEVMLEGRPIPLARWRSRKARQMLKMLIAAGDGRIPREVLLERLWPDDAIERTGPRLSVQLSTVRAVLDPDRQWPSDRYLVADRTAVGLHRERLTIDVDRFVAEADAGSSDLALGDVAAGERALEGAEALYRGDFLGEDVYEDWAAGPREAVRVRYQRVVRDLADLAASRDDTDAAVGYLLRLLEHDPWDEPGHLSLVDALRRAGRRGEAKRAYRRYVERMAELGVEATPFEPIVVPARP